MLSRAEHSTEDSKIVKKKRECACASIRLEDRTNGEQKSPVALECSSHPGFCVLDDRGFCTKRENAIHCADVPLKALGEALTTQNNQKDQEEVEEKRCCSGGMSDANKKVHYYKIDLNNSEDTGLIADKQCQTCGPDCGPATCSSRSRQFFISWDKVRTKLFLFLIFGFILWLSVYSALSLTSSL